MTDEELERVSLRTPSPALLDWLGQGEVRLEFAGQRIIESRLPGLWIGASGIECAEFPRQALALLHAAWDKPVPQLAEEHPGTMNAAPLLTEVRAHALAWQARGATEDFRELLDLSRLPLTHADHAFLEQVLGQGPVIATVDCDGECRLSATTVPGVWWVRYFDGEGRELLTTLEVGLVPSLARAASEEVAASIAELEQYLGQGDALSPGAP